MTPGDMIERHPFLRKFKDEMERAGILRPPGLALSSKSFTRAGKYRYEGNVCYEDRKFDEAREYYSRCAAWAPKNSRELPLAFGNRSAVSFHLENFDYCLLDINRALQEPYIPKKTRGKLLERRAKCWKRMMQAWNNIKQGRPSRIKNTLERISNYFNEMRLDETDLFMNYAEFDDPIWSTNLENALLPNVSLKVKLEQNFEWGQHWVAKNDIKPGEVLLIQEHYAIKLLETALTEHCAYCTLYCTALIPCSTCCEEMYCSKGCQLEAYNLYHRVECKMLPYLKLDVPDEEIVAIRLALRAFLTGTKQGSELINLMQDVRVHDMINGAWSCTGQELSWKDYASILSMPWKSCRSSSVHLVGGKWAALKSIFKALLHVNFFNDGAVRPKSRVLTEVELFAALLLSQNLFIEESAVNSLYTQICGGTEGWIPLVTNIGSGVGTLRNLMNQSCIANTNVIQDKRRLLVYCSKPIKAGEQIFTAYEGADYLKSGRCCRKFFLKEIGKVCKCKACVEGWPNICHVLEEFDKFKTSDQAITKKTKEMHEFLFSMLVCTDGIDEDDIIHKVFEFSATFGEYLKEPSATMCRCHQVIFLLMSLKGNRYFKKTHTKYVYDDNLNLLFELF